MIVSRNLTLMFCFKGSGLSAGDQQQGMSLLQLPAVSRQVTLFVSVQDVMF